VKLPIRDQILWPLMGLLLVAVAANAAFSAWWMSTRSRLSLEARQRQILGVFEESSFPLSATVMAKLQRLTGDELIVWDSAAQQVIVGTLPEDDLSKNPVDWNSVTDSNAEPHRVTIAGATYVAHAGRLRGNPSHTMFVLTSDDRLRKVSREAIWPPLAIGALTIIVSIPLVLKLASSWARRIHSLEQHVQSIAGGDFGRELKAGQVDDELARLVDSINSMSRQLRSMQERLIRGERTRLVAQLTAGFAHQLRNGIAGAKLAIQLHESRCRSSTDTSLNVACNQLALVEEEVQGLLSLGKGEQQTPASVDLVQVVRAVQSLVSISCEHRGVTLQLTVPDRPLLLTGYADGLRAAILNLTLNAIDAAGPGGNIWLTMISCDDKKVLLVEDSGPGPAAEIGQSLFESFVTSKPEGVGLGLTVAATVARTHGGTLNWKRTNNRTQFELVLPVQRAVNESDGR